MRPFQINILIKNVSISTDTMLNIMSNFATNEVITINNKDPPCIYIIIKSKH